MARRPTRLLDEGTRRTARQLTASDDCSVSEAIRQRVETLERLFDLFENNDPDEETRRLKAHDDGF